MTDLRRITEAPAAGRASLPSEARSPAGGAAARTRRSLPSGRRSRARSAAAAGFTLLEVMVSLAILAISLVAILQLHSGGVSMHNHAKHLTVATLLARGKMIDIEEYLYEEGLDEFDQTLEGDFEEEGYKSITWRAEIVKPELELDSAQLMSMLGSGLGLGGEGDDSGGSGGPEAAGGLAALGPMAGAAQGMIQGQVQNLITTLEEGVREIRLTVYWKDITGPSEFSVVTHMVRLPEMSAPGDAQDKQKDRLQSLQELQKQLPSGGRLPGTGQLPSRGGGKGGINNAPRLPTPFGR